jgi:hypothetical protein
VRHLIERSARVTGRFRLVLVLIAAAAVAACGTPSPRITFTEIPPTAVGGPIRTATISGRVEGARPGDRIVLFAKSGAWYVQPLRSKPFTAIDAEGRWRSTIHLGTEYAAMVVRADYRPPNSTAKLPDLGDRVLAVATVNGRAGEAGGSAGNGLAGSGPVGNGPAGNGPAPPLQFSGYEWDVRQYKSDRGGPNEYSGANAVVEADGALRLKLVQRDKVWTSAGVCLTRPLGYGTYVFIVRDMAEVDPAARLALFTFDKDGRAVHFREMNIDLWHANAPGTWGGQFVVQPNYLAGNLYRFSVPSGRVSHTMRWEPGVVVFKSMRGNFLEQTGEVIASQAFTTGVPGPGDERICMAYYYHRKSAREPRADSGIVIERFQYLP